MSGTVKVTQVKLGDSADPTKNFQINVPAVPDGTLTIERGDGADVMKFLAGGGVATNGGTVAPAAGMVGEILTGNSGSTAIASGSYYGATFLTIPAGVWDIQGNVNFSAVTGPSQMRSASINTVNSAHGPGLCQLSNTMTVGFSDILWTGLVRVVLSVPTIYYVVGRASFSGGTMTINSADIYARRVA